MSSNGNNECKLIVDWLIHTVDLDSDQDKDVRKYNKKDRRKGN